MRSLLRISPYSWSVCCLVAGLVISTGLVQAAPPTVSSLYPAGGKQGEKVEVELTGKPGTLPLLAVAVDHPELKFQASEKGDKLTVEIAPEALPGLYWIRLYNNSGANRLLPFHVGTFPEVLEKEPNETRPQAGEALALPVVVNGKLQRGGDVDSFPVSLKQGQTLVASLDAHRSLRSPMDAAMQLIDERGFVVQQNDDHHGFDPLITWTAQADGVYYIRVYAFPSDPNSSVVYAGGADYVYRLTLTTGPFAVSELAVSAEAGPIVNGWNLEGVPADQIAKTAGLHHLSRDRLQGLNISRKQVDPLELTLPALIAGNLDEKNPVDRFAIKLEKGDGLRIRVLARELDSLLDPHLEIRDGEALVRELDDINRNNLDIDANWQAPNAKVYHFHVKDRYQHTGEHFHYMLWVEKEVPRLVATVTADQFVGTAGKPLEIPITLTRFSALKETIQFRVEGLKETQLVEFTASENKGDEAKKGVVKITNQGEELFQGPVKIIAEWGPEEARQQQAITFSLGVANYETEQIWLTLPGTPKPAATEATAQN